MECLFIIVSLTSIFVSPLYIVSKLWSLWDSEFASHKLQIVDYVGFTEQPMYNNKYSRYLVNTVHCYSWYMYSVSEPKLLCCQKFQVHDLVRLYNDVDVPPERLLFKISSTWQVSVNSNFKLLLSQVIGLIANIVFYLFIQLC